MQIIISYVRRVNRMVQKNILSPKQMGLMVALMAAATPLTTSLSLTTLSLLTPVQSAQAVAVPFPLPSGIPQGTAVRISSANSMAGVNQALKQQFEKEFSKSKATVNVSTTSVQSALKAVLDGKADLAAIGRPLTEAEVAQGLVAIPVGRDKIAIVVGSGNPFKKDLSIPKFAKIFRGELKNWSELGGQKAAIQVLDRVNSDTRQAFPTYPAFQSGKFNSGATATQLEDTSMKAVLGKLGKNGVSFVPANQLKNQSGFRVLSMDGVDPSNPKYPFSQPLFYVYKGPKPNPAVQAFLGVAGTTAGQKAIQQSGIAQAIDFNQPGEIDKAQAASAAANKAVSANAPKGKAQPGAVSNADRPSSIAANNAPNPGVTGEQINPAPNNPVSAAEDKGILGNDFPDWLKWLLPLGLLGLGLLLLLLPRKADESSETATLGDRAAPVPTPSFSDSENESNASAAWAPFQTEANDDVDVSGDAWNDRSGEVADDRDALGIPPVSGGTIAGGMAATGAAGAAAWSFLQGQQDAAEGTDTPAETEITLGSDWEFESSNLDELPPDTRGRLDDVVLDADEGSPIGDGDSSGSGTGSPSFLGNLQNSASTFMTNAGTAAENVVEGVTQVGGDTLAAGAAFVGGTAAAARTRILGDRAKIVLIPQTSKEAVVRWQLTDDQKTDAHNRGGVDLALRLYDVTGIDPNQAVLENFYQYDCSELTQELRIEVPVPDRDYVVEVGYLNRLGEWIDVARSMSVHIPPA
ncbi:substrate-binding domain-containing protein [Alkalinema pantanalense CENA528]|uniref:substrate-binding domain-containing protein n=1 Tax=Alkalinema pantanalense TaxID=1620705 RepID=UPI003D6F09F7